MVKRLIISFFIAITLLLLAFLLINYSKRVNISQMNLKSPEKIKDTPLLSVIAQNLEVPWSLAFLPDGNLLVTERMGNLKLVDLKTNQTTLIEKINEVKQKGEGGLHGVTLHPDFNKNNFIYLYYTYQENKGNTFNRVVRYILKNNKLLDRLVIVDAISGAMFHDGGRIKFGPDKYLYITTGDAQIPSLSQDKNKLAGKILRVTDDGQAAPDNPFGSRIYSYGHRNPQCITWDEEGNLWSLEHGSSAFDEINFIEKGKNYGWPEIRGDEKKTGMENPILHSSEDTWAPGGCAFFENSIYFGGLRGQALYEGRLNGKNVKLAEHLKGKLGRIRDVVLGPDGFLYITTSNRDGRGILSLDDDKLIRVNVSKLR